MKHVIRVIRIPSMRSSLRTPISEPYTQLVTDLNQAKQHWDAGTVPILRVSI
jgi:hypothetical protein